MKPKPHPSQEIVKSLLHYDPETGVFTWLLRDGSDWRTRSWNTKWAGKVAGGITQFGYWRIPIRGEAHQAHRLAWVYVNGSIPDGYCLDHINRDGIDNRINNLRLATPQQNSANQRQNRNSKAPFKGITFQDGGWAARIKIRDKSFYLGTYKTPEEAHAAYVDAAKTHFGEYARAA